MGNRPFTIYVIQHSHIDIGFTDRQEKITSHHRSFMRQAIDLALSERQHTRGENLKFKFTCEGFWAVEQFLERASDEERRRLIRAFHEGSMELTAFYFHLAELLDQGHLRESLQPAVAFAERYHIPLTTAMACDINGFSWGMADALHEAGIRYLSVNINSHHGGYPFGKPLVPFYWESPKGNRILVWSGYAYHKANLLGLIPGFNPDEDPGIPGLLLESGGGYTDIVTGDIRIAENKLFPLVDRLRKDGYAFEFLPLMGSGLYTDNSPPTDQLCEHLKAWNDKHGDRVQIRTATLDEFFRRLEAESDRIPVAAGDWNDWWTDGVISTPLETAIFRHAQRTKRTVERLDPTGQFVERERLQSITHKLMLYSEHTWGHSSSLSRPWDFKVQQTFLRKTKMAVEADEAACSALDDVLIGKGAGDFTARQGYRFKVINPAKETRRAIALLPLERWESPVLDKGFRVVDQKTVLPHVRIERSLRGQEFGVLLELGPLEERELTLELYEASSALDIEPPNGHLQTGRFAGNYYSVEWDTTGIRSLVHQNSDKQLLLADELPLGSPVYQLFPGGNRGDAAGYLFREKRIPASHLFQGYLKAVRQQEANRFVETWEFDYEVEGADGYKALFTFYRDLPRFDLSILLNKTNVTDPEGMYTAFPFDLGQEAIWHLDKAGASVRPGLDQLPSTCCDYYSVQSGAVLCGDRMGLAWTSLDAPMVHIGKPRLWNYDSTIEPKGTLYSWLCNNKWETNFKAVCGGFYEFRYVIEFGEGISNPKAAIATCEANSSEFIVIRL